jgi:ComF family protein
VRLSQRAQELIGHVGRNLIADCSRTVGVGIQKPLQLSRRSTGRDKRIHDRSHIRTALGGEDRQQLATLGTAATPPAGRLLTITAPHALSLAATVTRGKLRWRLRVRSMLLVQHLWEAALNLFYPPTCCGCGQATERLGFCIRCRARIETPRTPLCATCGAPFHTSGGSDHPCGRCLSRPPRFGRARACAIYDAADTVDHPLKSVLQRYKYNRDVSLARPLGELLQERAPLAVTAYDVIMPVPLYVQRLRWRGFNQAQCLARALARSSRVPLDPFSLQRVRPTRPQVQLNEAERRRNVARAFAVVRPQRVRGQRILLVDDVYTTGATVDECSGALHRAGAHSVDVLVLARAVLQ